MKVTPQPVQRALGVMACACCVLPVQAQDVLYVDADAAGAGDGSSWCDAYTYLQDALAAADASGGTVTEVRVAQGVYNENVYLDEYESIYGGYDPATWTRNVPVFRTEIRGTGPVDDDIDFIPGIFIGMGEVA